jgi:ribose 1,5-bisphosphokinase
MIPAPDRAGRLVYVMGPSGAGKDTLIAYARERVDPARVVFAHRYITRAANAGGENHVALSEAEFRSRFAAGLFALSWESHGFSYGIGVEIELWEARGLVVVVSAARAAWSKAKLRYPHAIGVLVDAPVKLRAERLAQRGRENETAIRERLEQDVGLPPDEGVRWLDNSGVIASAGEAFLRIVVEHLALSRH